MRRAFAIAPLVFLLAAGGLNAQDATEFERPVQPHPESREAISSLYSPYCPGFMLEVCTSGEARALRDSIHTLAHQGWSSAELVDWMLSIYGSQYLAVPQRSGWGIWAWILPVWGLLAGLALVIWALRRFAPRPPDEKHVSTDGFGEEREWNLTPEEEERLREAIREVELSEDPSY